MHNQDSQRDHTMALSVLIGGIIGWAIGMGQMLVMNTWAMFYWPFMAMMPIYSGLGFALYGMILGGSGVFSKTVARTEVEEPKEIRPATHAA